jgi:hypothetical protein
MRTPGGGNDLGDESYEPAELRQSQRWRELGKGRLRTMLRIEVKRKR